MYSEVRPQVFSKLRPRYEAIQNPNKPEGDLDVDFQKPHSDPDTLDLMNNLVLEFCSNVCCTRRWKNK